MTNDKDMGYWAEYTEMNGWKIKYPAPHERLVNAISGRQCVPSIFWPTWQIGMLLGTLWTTIWATVMYLFVWRDISLSQTVLSGLTGGVLFGMGAALFHSYQKRRHGLTTWETFIADCEKASRRTK